MVLGLCERFGCLPSALLQEDADLLRLLQLEALGREASEAQSRPADPGPTDNKPIPFWGMTLTGEPVEAQR